MLIPSWAERERRARRTGLNRFVPHLLDEEEGNEALDPPEPAVRNRSPDPHSILPPSSRWPPGESPTEVGERGLTVHYG